MYRKREDAVRRMGLRWGIGVFLSFPIVFIIRSELPVTTSLQLPLQGGLANEIHRESDQKNTQNDPNSDTSLGTTGESIFYVAAGWVVGCRSATAAGRGVVVRGWVATKRPVISPIGRQDTGQ